MSYPPDKSQYRPEETSWTQSLNPFRSQQSYAPQGNQYPAPAGPPPSYTEYGRPPQPPQQPGGSNYGGQYAGGPPPQGWGQQGYQQSPGYPPPSGPGPSYQYGQGPPQQGGMYGGGYDNSRAMPPNGYGGSSQASHSGYFAPSPGPPGEFNRSQSLTADSSASGRPSPGLMSKIKGSSASELLDPPPPCFSRPPRPDLPYSPFPPCALISLAEGLEKGFPEMPPPSAVQPHPFAYHDVSEEDWRRLLRDVKEAGKMSPVTKIVANVAPMAMGVGFLPGMFMSKAITRRIEGKRQGVVAELIEIWNHYYFYPRQMEVTLAQGKLVHSGSGDVPPDMMGGSSSHHSSHHDSSSDSSDDGRHGRHGGRREKRRHSDRREKRQERRAHKQEVKEVRGEKFRLIISYRPANAY